MSNEKIYTIVDRLLKQQYLEQYDLCLDILVDTTTEENVADIVEFIKQHPNGSELDYALYIEHASKRGIQSLADIIPALLTDTADNDAKECLSIALLKLKKYDSQ